MTSDLPGSLWRLSLILLWVASGCTKDGGDVDSTEVSDTDTDTDADSDTDTDTDADSDTDTDTDSGLSCTGTPSTPVPGSDGLPSCVTATIACGETVIGTTVGGSTHYDSAMYEDGACVNPGDDYSAPERVYQLTVPAGKSYSVAATVCSGLKLRRVYGLGSSSCPNSLSFQNNPACEQAFDRGGGLQELTTTPALQADTRYELIIDGLDNATGNYSLTVTCNP